VAHVAAWAVDIVASRRRVNREIVTAPGLLRQKVVVWAEVNAAERGRLKLSTTENGVLLMRFIEGLLIDR
jgi:hypothetical protein